MLQSKQNPRIKYVRRLVQRKFRESEGKFVIEGVRFLEEAVKVDWPVEMVLHTPRAAGSLRAARLLELLAERGVPVREVAEGIFAELADTDTPQGVLAVVKMPRRGAFDPAARGGESRDLLVLVDGIRDPGNLGTIIRCADAAGVDAVILLKGVVDPYNAKTLRATMGSVFHVPLFTAPDRDRLLEELHAGGWSLVVGDLSSEKLVHQCDLTGRVALAVGSEADGVSEAVLQAARERVRIPMPGRAESLNAGVAAGIMLYETVRQRMDAGKEIARTWPSFFS
ncbi:TrmH family RNA methyltransferase [Desulfoscipio geothermicus]|uniref:RNA methyltransferase, TrmH family n=1 Tax=Desulfoscipio geothermicus DSM 3669 TaxID=1121426 RepID=A0A1I6E8M0_9FIRM|nr:RNA methyltransferase [Desulfoscipio geothermicus]SFR13868.1 RNA methyltransferase, TrmH family [Desulfoscipio geothermicus DSM 3669]